MQKVDDLFTARVAFGADVQDPQRLVLLIGTLLCALVQSVESGPENPYMLQSIQGERSFKLWGNRFATDKTSSHSYQTMYGAHLYPIRNRSIKLLEIGLGCTSWQAAHGGKGASAKMWQKFLPKAELWFAEFNGACVKDLRVRAFAYDAMP